MHGKCIKINQNYPLGFLHSLARFGNTPVAEVWQKSRTRRHIRGLLEKYPTFGREKETGLLGALDT